MFQTFSINWIVTWKWGYAVPMTAGVSLCSHDKRWYTMKLLFHIKQSAVSETCNQHRSKMRIQIIQLHNSSAPLTTAELGLLAKPTEMSQVWNSLPLHPTVGQQAFQDQPFSALKSTALYHMVKSSSLGDWFILHGCYHEMRPQAAAVVFAPW